MNTTTIPVAPTESPAPEAAVDQYLAQLARLQAQMADDREEILALQSETRAILENVMAALGAR